MVPGLFERLYENMVFPRDGSGRPPSSPYQLLVRIWARIEERNETLAPVRRVTRARPIVASTRQSSRPQERLGVCPRDRYRGWAAHHHPQAVARLGSSRSKS
jgi:hypothetical protein